MILGQREKQQKAIEEQRKWQLTVTNEKKKNDDNFHENGEKNNKIYNERIKKI